jgi:hypothetical protein
LWSRVITHTAFSLAAILVGSPWILIRRMIRPRAVAAERAYGVRTVTHMNGCSSSRGAGSWEAPRRSARRPAPRSRSLRGPTPRSPDH